MSTSRARAYPRVTALLATRSLRVHRRAWAAVFAAVAFTSLLLGPFALLLTSAGLGHPRVERYVGAQLVVAADQSTRHTDKPWGSDPETVRAALTERVQIPAQVRDVVQDVPGVRAAVADVSFPVRDHGATSVGRPWPAAQLASSTLRSGHAPEHPDEIVVSGGNAPAGRATMSVGDQKAEYTVVGVADGPAGTVYFSDTEAYRLRGSTESVDAVGVIGESGVSTDELRARVRHALTAADLKDVVAGQRADGDSSALQVLTGNGRGSAEFLNVAPARANLLELLASVLSTMVLVAVLVVAATIVQALGQRAGELGLLRAVGATPRQLRTAVGREVRRVAVCAALVGAAGTIPAALGLRALLNARGAVPDGLELPMPAWLWLGPLVTAGVTVLIAWVASLFALRRLGRVRPAEALRDSRPGRGRFVTGYVFMALGVTAAGTSALQHGETAIAAASTAALTMVIGCALLGPWITRGAMRVLGAPLRRLGGVGGYLAAANCISGARRFGAALTPIILVTAFAGIQLAASATFGHQADAQGGAALRADLAVTVPGGHNTDAAARGGIPDQTLEQIRSVPGVQAATGVAHSSVVVAGREAGSPTLERLPVLGVTPEGLEHTLDPGVKSGSLRELQPGTVAVGADRARSLHARPGSTVTVRFGDGAQARLRVVAVYERSVALGDFLFSRDELTRHMSAPVTDRVLVAAHDAEPVSEALGAVVPDGQVEREPAPERVQADDEALGELVTIAAVAAIGGFTVIAVLSTLTLITVGRRPELGVLRLSGVGRGRLRGMLWLEAGTLAVSGLVVGAAVAAVPLLAFSFAVVHALPYLPPVRAGAIFAIVAATTAAGVLLPARAALRGRYPHR